MKKVTFLFLLLPFFCLTQNSGNLNTNYANNGIANFFRQANFVTEDATLQGNKILVSGRVSFDGNSNIIIRYNADGTIDKTFANNGAIDLEFNYTGGVSKIETYPNGAIIFEAYNNGIPRMIKYHENGTVDSSFGNNGLLLLDFLPHYGTGGVEVFEKPILVPDTYEIIVPIATRNQSLTQDFSYLLKLTANGVVETSFDGTGYSGNFTGHIMCIDRNKYSNSFFENLFGGVEGDYILGVNTVISNKDYNQYIPVHGNFTRNTDNYFGEPFVNRFYERQNIQITTNIASFDGINLYRSIPVNNLTLPSYTFQETYKTTTANAKPGFKVMSSQDFIIFGTKPFQVSENANSNFIVNRLEKNKIDFDGVTEIDVSDGYNDYLIDCFEKPNGSILCIGYSQINSINHLSMAQIYPNGIPDGNLNGTGKFVSNADYQFQEGLLTEFFDGFYNENGEVWAGKSIEPYTGNVNLEISILDRLNNAIAYDDVSIIKRTKYKSLDIKSVLSYSDFSFGNSNNGFLNSLLMVGSVESEGNNDFMLARHTTQGIDFGGADQMLVKTDINNGSNDIAKSAVIQNDKGVKKILVVGESDGNLAMVRYFAEGNDAGLIDTSFGVNGIVSKNSRSKQKLATIPFVPNMVKATTNGTLYMCGEETNGNIKKFTLKKFDALGIEDTGFQAFDELSNVDNVAQNFEILSDGSFILIGQTGDFKTKIRKHNPDGTADSTFGNNSYLYLEAGASQSKLNDIQILEDGRIVVVGYVDNDALISLFDVNGNLDTNFAANGILKTKYNFDAIKLKSVIQEDDNNILVSGTSELNGSLEAFTAQILIQDALSVDMFNKSSFKIHPNPASSTVIIKSNNNVKINNVLFFNVMGKRVKTVTSDFESIDVQNLSKGLYFVKIKSDLGEVSKKLLLD